MKKALFAIVGFFAFCFNAIADSTVNVTDNIKVTFTQDVIFVPDGKTVTYITVYEENSDKASCDYKGFQMRWTVPQGIKINEIKSGRKTVADITINSDRFDGLDPQTVTASMPNENTIKFSYMTSSGDTFYNDDLNGNPVKELFKIGLVASEGMADAKDIIKVDDIKFIHKDSSADKPASEAEEGFGISYTISNSTGIQNLSVSNNQPSTAYSVSGIKVSKIQKGQLYIVDGKKFVNK